MNEYGYMPVDKKLPIVKGEQCKAFQIEWDTIPDEHIGQICTLSYCHHRRPILAGDGFEIVPEKEARLFDGTPREGIEFIDEEGIWEPAETAVWRDDVTFRRRINAATAIQPQPKGQGADITKLVQADLEARAAMGEKKYGERLRANNGRNAKWDAYQEALDLCCYLRQVIEEGK